MPRIPSHMPPMQDASQQAAHAANSIKNTAALEQALALHAIVRQTSQWMKLGAPPQVTACELEMLQLSIKTLLQNIITPAADAPASRPHKAYIEALSDFRVAISVWLLNVRRGAGIASSATLQYELHASKTEFLGKLWLNTLAAPAAAKTTQNNSRTLRKLDKSGWWQSKRPVHSGWSLVPQSM